MGPTLTPVVRNLLIACVAMFVLQQLYPRVEDTLKLWPPGYGLFRPWQLVTYGFLHGGFLHIFTNMFALYMFGPDLERLVGPKRFFTYYIVCIISAAVTQLLVSPFSTVGASGGIFGLLLAFGLAYPHRKLMLFFPPIPMPAWLFVTLYGLLELYLGISGRVPGVAHFAHLGGMIGGFALILYWRAQVKRRPT